MQIKKFRAPEPGNNQISQRKKRPLVLGSAGHTSCFGVSGVSEVRLRTGCIRVGLGMGSKWTIHRP
jgi:hypothetical protein